MRSRRLLEPITLIGLFLIALLGWIVAWPLVQMLRESLQAGAFSEVATGRLSSKLLWEPTINTVIIGGASALLAMMVGGCLAWLVTMSDVRGRLLLGILATIPFALPKFALALAWQTVFRNELVGSDRAGLLHQAGLPVPDWLAWGTVPCIVILAAHGSALAFLLISAALSSVGGDLHEAAELTGASRSRIGIAITLPTVMPALVAATLLNFAEGASNFSVPALLGTPVRLQTLSTRVFTSVETGNTERGFALALSLIVVASIALLVGQWIQRRRRSAVISGKGLRRGRVPLGRARLAMSVGAWAIAMCATVVPTALLILSSLQRRNGSMSEGLTLHYWIGDSDPDVDQGQSGILRNDVVVDAIVTTLWISAAVALIATLVGTFAALVIKRSPSNGTRTALSGLTFLPFLIPGVALGAVLIGQFGRDRGPIPALYGTPALLVLGGAISTLPFAAQSARASLAQVGDDLDEAAALTGSSLLRRLRSIVLPLIMRGLIVGAILAFIKMARDLDLVALLATPTTTTLSVVTYRYASESFTQLANATTVLIIATSIAVTLLARRLEGKASPWNS